MEIKIDFTEKNFMDYEGLKKTVDINNNPPITSLDPGQWGGQTVANVYLVNNKVIDFGGKSAKESKIKPNSPDNENLFDTISFRGLLFDIISFKKTVNLYYELLTTPFRDKYKLANNFFYPLLSIQRENIIGFEKDLKVNFFAINYKNSLAFSDRVDSALGMRPVGVLPYLLMKGVTSAINSTVNKNEEELIEKTGQKYTLKFTHEGEEAEIEVICEENYVDTFEDFLRTHWSKEEPIKEQPDKKTNIGELLFRILMVLLALGFIVMVVRMVMAVFK